MPTLDHIIIGAREFRLFYRFFFFTAIQFAVNLQLYYRVSLEHAYFVVLINHYGNLNEYARPIFFLAPLFSTSVFRSKLFQRLTVWNLLFEYSHCAYLYILQQTFVPLNIPTDNLISFIHYAIFFFIHIFVTVKNFWNTSADIRRAL